MLQAGMIFQIAVLVILICGFRMEDLSYAHYIFSLQMYSDLIFSCK